MSFARAGRRAVIAVLRGTPRPSLVPSVGTGVVRRPLVFGAGVRLEVTTSRAALARSAGEVPVAAYVATRLVLRKSVVSDIARALITTAAVAGGCGLALCDASNVGPSDDANAPRFDLRKLTAFGRNLPSGTEEEVGDDEPPQSNGSPRSESAPNDATFSDADGAPGLELVSVPDAPAEVSAEARPLTGVSLALDLAREHWRSLLLAVLATVLASVLKMTSMRRMSRIYDLIRAPGALGGGVPIAPLLELAALRAAEATAKFFLAKVSGDARTAMERNLRLRLFAALLTEDASVAECRSAGERRERLGAEVAQVSDVVTRALTGGVKSFATATHGVVSLVRISWEISAVALGTVPAGVALFGVLGGMSARAHRDAAAAKERAASVASERLSGFRTVRQFAAEETELQRYDNALGEAAKKRRLATSIHALHLALFAAVPSTAVAAWLWYGGQLVERGRLSVGELTVVVPLALEVANALAGISELHAEVAKGLDGADRAALVLGTSPIIEIGRREMLLRRRKVDAGWRTTPKEGPDCDKDVAHAKEEQKLPTLRGAIDFESVHFAYPTRSDRAVLKGFDLSLAPGEVFALVGPSGGGKSTVGALLERFYDPTSGSVSVDGERVDAVDLGWLRENIGAVSQDPTLFAGTIAENIAYAKPNATRAEIVAAAEAANASEFVERFPDGYDTLVGERGALLSGGQRQRIAIARVVLADPRVLLLDEATSALDAKSEAAVSEALERVAKGRTTVVIAHRLGTVRRAHRVGVLIDGKLVECGTHEELIQKRGGMYAELVKTQIEGGGG